MNCTVKEFNVWMISETYRVEPISPRVRHMLYSTSFWWTKLIRLFLQVRSLTKEGNYLRLTRKSPSLDSGSDFTLKGRLTRPSLLDAWQNLLPRACINTIFLYLLQKKCYGVGTYSKCLSEWEKPMGAMSDFIHEVKIIHSARGKETRIHLFL